MLRMSITPDAVDMLELSTNAYIRNDVRHETIYHMLVRQGGAYGGDGIMAARCGHFLPPYIDSSGAVLCIECIGDSIAAYLLPFLFMRNRRGGEHTKALARAMALQL